MPKKKKSAKKKSAGTRRTGAAKKDFTDALIIRGEAVPKKSPGDKLPPGATHWLGEDESGAPTVKRARFKLL